MYWMYCKEVMVDYFIFQNKISSITVYWSCSWHSKVSFLCVLVWFLFFFRRCFMISWVVIYLICITMYCLHSITSFHHIQVDLYWALIKAHWWLLSWAQVMVIHCTVTRWWYYTAGKHSKCSSISCSNCMNNNINKRCCHILD